MADWKEAKRRILAEARCIVFKVGSAVIAGPDGLDRDVMDSLAAQMGALSRMPDGGRRTVVLVTSAAVAAGRSVLKEAGIDQETSGMAAKQAAAAVGQAKVMHCWDVAFRRQGLHTAQVLLTRDDFKARERLLNAKNTFGELLQWGVVPVVNENDTVSIAELKFGDNDTLASLLVNLVGADLYVSVTSAPGVFGASPDVNPDATVLPCIEDVFALNLGKLCGGKTTVGTGGMYSKLLAARRAAQRGVPTFILPGREPDILVRALDPAGPDLGTWVAPLEHAIPARKFWIAYKQAPQGEIEIDAGAADALANKGRSLLPGGVTKVSGPFPKGALVSVVHAGESIGVGLSNYSSQELDRIKGLKRFEVAAALGDAHYPEVIHRDNLLLHAAV
ncbi:MAG: glutamate 5-kinase [Desulfovibrio sp.]|nr:glutamate 5-kinase [Desulfovibrio sp.]